MNLISPRACAWGKAINCRFVYCLSSSQKSPHLKTRNHNRSVKIESCPAFPTSVHDVPWDDMDTLCLLYTHCPIDPTHTLDPPPTHGQLQAILDSYMYIKISEKLASVCFKSFWQDPTIVTNKWWFYGHAYWWCRSHALLLMHTLIVGISVGMAEHAATILEYNAWTLSVYLSTESLF